MSEREEEEGKKPIALSTELSRNYDNDFKFIDELNTKEKYVHIQYTYLYIKKRLFIQKCICAPYLRLKLCLMNCFIKKLTRYKFDCSEMRGSFSRHTYINLYVLICTKCKQSLAHLHLLYIYESKTLLLK